MYSRLFIQLYVLAFAGVLIFEDPIRVQALEVNEDPRWGKCPALTLTCLLYVCQKDLIC